MNRKKITQALSALAFVSLVAACPSEDPKPTDTTPPKTPTSAPADAKPAMATGSLADDAPITDDNIEDVVDAMEKELDKELADEE